MNALNQRKQNFVFGCLFARFIIAYSCFYIPDYLLPMKSIVIFMIGSAFIYLYMFKLRMNAPEGGGKTWWNYARPLHGLLYVLASILLITGDRVNAAYLLFADVFFGLIAFLYNHYA